MKKIKFLLHVIANIAFVVLLPQVAGVCTTDGCSTACNFMCLNANQSGSCNSGYPNPLLSNDRSCVCDGCPAITACDIVRTAELASNGTCFGPPLSNLLGCSATGCPQDILSGKLRVPHFCTVGGQSFCVCMCVSCSDTFALMTCPIKGLLSWWPW